MELYGKECSIYGNCMTSIFAQPGLQLVNQTSNLLNFINFHQISMNFRINSIDIAMDKNEGQL